MALFTARLVNDSFGDAALYLESPRFKDAFLFDLGDLHALKPKELAKISRVFISHTHLDHFSGFEQLLRANLSRPTPLHLYGPKHIIRQVKAKLQGFTWNLITDPVYSLELIVTEVRPRRLLHQRFLSQNVFKSQGPPEKESFKDGLLLDTPDFKINCAILDHGTPCLAFALIEKQRCNIETRALDVLGLQDGPWLKPLKKLLLENGNDHIRVTAPQKDGLENTYDLGYLRRHIVEVKPERKIAYVTDLAHTNGNIRRARKLAYKADVLFVEAAFMEDDREHAVAKNHLTAAQAGALIKMCKAKKWVLFHFSHKYRKREDLVWREARCVVKGTPHDNLELPLSDV